MRALKKTVMTTLALMLMAAPAWAEATVGQPAPAFTLTDINGTSHSLADYQGKTVVLEWTNHECPYVVKHYDTGNMQKLQEQAAAEDIVWLTVNSSAAGKQGNVSPEEAKAIMEKTGAKPAAYLYDPDGTVGKAYGAKTTPHMYVINDEGTLAYMGAIDDNPSSRHETVETANNYVLAALEAAKTGTAPANTQTKPYGCGVKYQAM